MSYSVDSIYSLVGREDKVATLTLYPDSEVAKKYGKILTVIFNYEPSERKLLEDNFLKKVDEGRAAVTKVKFLTGDDLCLDSIKTLEKEGINTSDIADILFSPWFKSNTYHSKDIRKLEKLNIAMKIEPKGRDYDWIYGFTKDRLKRGIGLPPDDMDFFYACKLYYEPHSITPDERARIYIAPNVLRPEIELKLIEIRVEREEDEPEDLKRFEELCNEIGNGKKAMQLISAELISAGTSIRKLYLRDSKLLFRLFTRLTLHKDIHLNVKGKIPIYLDKKGLLHIFLRHVREFQVSEHYNGKDNFQWMESDVIRVISAVISDVDAEVQAYWNKNNGKRFSKYGAQSHYYEGDYYTFHIEGDGRLSTFHKNEK